MDWALPILGSIGVREVARRTGVSRGATQAVLAGEALPRPEALRRYLEAAELASVRSDATDEK